MIINVSYDSSVNSAPAAFKTAVSAAIQFLENIFTNPITITIAVGYGEVNGQPLSSGALGESETFFNTYSYTQIRNALTQNARSADQTSAANTLPVSDPTNGGNYWMATAEAKALGLIASNSTTDGFIGLSSSFQFDYDPSNGITSGTYDFNGTFLHELTEVMGRVLFVGTSGIGPNAYTPLDLFHYSAPGVRTFSATTTGYFSLDGGTTNLNYFNTNPNGDFGDWASSAGHDSFLAFSNSGVVNEVTQTDLRVMNVLGYNETVPVPIAIGIGDFNGDHVSDLLFQSTATNSLTDDLMNGTTVTASATISNPSGLQAKATGDFNHDTNADIVLQASDGTPQIWFMNGTSVAGSTSLSNPGASWHVIATGDFNHDGNADILWRDNNGTPAIWEMNGTILIGGGAMSNPGSNWRLVGTGDFNADGNSDILWQSTDGTPAIWEMNGTTIIGGGAMTNPGVSWHAIGTGDFNADGKADILWQNNNGTPAIWEMNGTTIIGGGAMTNPGVAWHAIGTGDFNNDGKSDILWQSTDGTPAIWEMNGTTIIGGGAVTKPTGSIAADPAPQAGGTTIPPAGFLAAPDPAAGFTSDFNPVLFPHAVFGASG